MLQQTDRPSIGFRPALDGIDDGAFDGLFLLAPTAVVPASRLMRLVPKATLGERPGSRNSHQEACSQGQTATES